MIRALPLGTEMEDHLEYTEDGGQSWIPGNRQRFRKLGRAPQ